jgi:hypothetical protein
VQVIIAKPYTSAWWSLKGICRLLLLNNSHLTTNLTEIGCLGLKHCNWEETKALSLMHWRLLQEGSVCAVSLSQKRWNHSSRSGNCDYLFSHPSTHESTPQLRNAFLSGIGGQSGKLTCILIYYRIHGKITYSYINIDMKARQFCILHDFGSFNGPSYEYKIPYVYVRSMKAREDGKYWVNWSIREPMAHGKLALSCITISGPFISTIKDHTESDFRQKV